MIQYNVDVDDLRQIENALGMSKDKSKQILKSAINSTEKETTKLLSGEANKRYYIKKTKVDKTLDTKKATVSNLEGLITSTGGVNELYDFRVSPKAYNPHNRPRTGHTGNVNRANSPKRLYLRPGATFDKYKAFVVRFKSGHVTIGQRVPGKRMKSNPKKEAVKELLSPSTPTLLGNEKGVYDIVQPQMYSILEKNIEQQIQRFLG